MSNVKIAVISAHPDDEAFCAAVTLHDATLQGHEALCLVATNGDAGKTGRLGPMSPEQLGEVRKREMETAANIIGISVLDFLGYRDGKLDEVDHAELTEHVIEFVNKHQVQIVLTFPEDGMSGHRDHKAIHHAVQDAVASGRCSSVQKLYYFTSRPLLEAGHEPSVRISSEIHWDVKKRALLAHESQILSVEKVFGDLTDPAQSRLPFESFVLAWERGAQFPNKKESFLTDGLQ